MRKLLILPAALLALGTAACTPAATTVDRVAGTNMSDRFPAQRDGTAANPAGTAAERAVDRAAGTNISGAFPSQRDGTAANPSGTAVSRALGTTDPEPRRSTRR